MLKERSSADGPSGSGPRKVSPFRCSDGLVLSRNSAPIGWLGGLVLDPYTHGVVCGPFIHWILISLRYAGV